MTAREIVADIFAEFLHQEGACQRPYDFADKLLARLIGTDDEPGVLDGYTVAAVPARGPGGKPLVVWRCGDDCRHVGIIARDMEMNQTNLTLGELVDAALCHGDEEHGRDRD